MKVLKMVSSNTNIANLKLSQATSFRNPSSGEKSDNSNRDLD